MDASEARFEILKIELSVLASKIDGTVNRLWRIRGFGLTLWSGLVALGLGVVKTNNEIIPELILLSTIIPMFFWWIDSTYNSWYMRFVKREKAICDFLNIGGEEDLSSFLSSEKPEFPVYDIGGWQTFSSEPRYYWEVSAAKHLLDTRAMIVFGGQVAISIILVFKKLCQDQWIFLLIPLVLIFTALINIIRIYRRFPRRGESS